MMLLKQNGEERINIPLKEGGKGKRTRLKKGGTNGEMRLTTS